jgi:hypothetical protein
MIHEFLNVKIHIVLHVLFLFSLASGVLECVRDIYLFLMF